MSDEDSFKRGSVKSRQQVRMYAVLISEFQPGRGCTLVGSLLLQK